MFKWSVQVVDRVVFRAFVEAHNFASAKHAWSKEGIRQAHQLAVEFHDVLAAVQDFNDLVLANDATGMIGVVLLEAQRRTARTRAGDRKGAKAVSEERSEDVRIDDGVIRAGVEEGAREGRLVIEALFTSGL